MRTIILTILLLVLAVAAGWITFSRSHDKTTITIDPNEVKEDTRNAVDQGKEWLESSSPDEEPRRAPER